MHEPSQKNQQLAHLTWPFAARGLLVLAIVYSLYFAASLLIPVVFAIFLNVAFSPLVRRAERFKIPKALSSALIVCALVGVGAGGLLMFAEPAEEWLSEAPRSVRELKTELLAAKGRLADIQELANEVEELAALADDNSAPQVTLQAPGVFEDAIGDLPFLFAGTGITIILTFFLLSSGNSFLRRVTMLGRSWSERRRIVTITRQIQQDLSRYLSTVTIINVLLGATTAAMLTVLGVSNPLLWGAMVCIFNFAPYFGALFSTGVLAIVGLGEFDTVSQGLLVPALFLALTILEGQLISPAVLGKRMALEPVTVFISVMFWGWLWGVAGALMAVPIVTSLRVVIIQTPALRPYGQLLFGRNLNQPSQEYYSAEKLAPNSARASASSSG